MAEPLSEVATPADAYRGKSDEAVWLPNERVAKAWMQYVKTGAVEDTTPPPAPYAVKTTASDKGVEITWDADADFESGIKHFIIERDGKQIGQVPEKAIGRFGRPLFQSMSYHDTPERPLPAMRFVDTTAKAGAKHDYRVIAVNSVGLKSESPKTASTPKPAATDADMRQAVERALPFLLEGGEQWRLGKTAGGQAGRICVTCHQIPFTIWPHNEAKARGFKIEQARLDDLSQWALEWCAVQKHPKTQSHTGGFLSTMQQMIMGRSAATPDKAALDTYTLFGKVIGSMQKEDGWWREGNQIKGKSTQRESDEVDTMWIILGLSSLEKIKLPKQTLDASAQHRQRAMKWLSEGKPGERIDWLALRMLLEREFGDAKKVGDWQKQVLALQNADGGWPLMKGEKSHPLVTGQSLYALNLVGLPREDPAIRRGASFLVNTQEKNGSWKALSRNAAHSNIVTIHWGTGWATIGLVRALP